VTIRSITVLAAQRDLRKGQPASAPPPTPEAVAAAGQPAGQASQAGQLDTLTAAVPSDVAALYTSVVGVLAGALKSNPQASYLPLRWGLYGGCLLAILVAVTVSYRSLPDHKRNLPVKEIVTALTAFAFWGLIIPESPLYVLVKAPTLPILVALLTGAGAFMLTSILRPWLGKNPK
jgi:hypothetical protein